MTKLFTPLEVRSVKFKNRIFVSPMCQYSADDGVATDWHFVHLGSRAVGGAALVMVEATAVTPEGRISAGDAGLWNENQLEAFSRITGFIKEQGAIAGIQLAHAGRKASVSRPWAGNKPLVSNEGGWVTVAPSAAPFDPQSAMPKALSISEIKNVIKDFQTAAKRAERAGFQVVEIHAAHGYLLHEFLSPLSNFRGDEYGGSLENRMRFVIELTSAVREVWPEKLPLFLRVSASDWQEGGWSVEDSVQLAKKLKAVGVDLIDVSSGGINKTARIKTGPGYQVPFARQIKAGAAPILVGAVGMITEPEQAEQILKENSADAVFLARELLRDPYWPLHAAHRLKVEVEWPKQYDRAKPTM